MFFADTAINQLIRCPPDNYGGYQLAPQCVDVQCVDVQCVYICVEGERASGMELQHWT